MAKSQVAAYKPEVAGGPKQLPSLSRTARHHLKSHSHRVLRGEQSAGPRVVRANLSGSNVEGVIDRCWGTSMKHLSESLLFTKQIPLFSGVGAANPFVYRTQRSKSKITDKTDNTAYFSILFLVPGERAPSLGNGKKVLLCSAPRG